MDVIPNKQLDERTARLKRLNVHGVAPIERLTDTQLHRIAAGKHCRKPFDHHC
jgi:hypothetical protein